MYDFRNLSESDLPLIWDWLQESHVQSWWPVPKKQYDLIAGDLKDPTIDLHLVSIDGVPFAYLQDYCVQDWMQPHLNGLPKGTRAIDLFIGDPAYLGKGHGAGLLRQQAQTLLDQGAPQVVIDPEPDNANAIKSYTLAGFQEVGRFYTEEGPALLMRFL